MTARVPNYLEVVLRTTLSLSKVVTWPFQHDRGGRAAIPTVQKWLFSFWKIMIYPTIYDVIWQLGRNNKLGTDLKARSLNSLFRIKRTKKWDFKSPKDLVQFFDNNILVAKNYIFWIFSDDYVFWSLKLHTCVVANAIVAINQYLRLIKQYPNYKYFLNLRILKCPNLKKCGVLFLESLICLSE
jgi:hypothetical protein